MKLTGTLYLAPGAPLKPNDSEAPGAIDPFQLSGLMVHDSAVLLATLALQMEVTWPSKVQPSCQGFSVVVLVLVMVTLAV